ncbi:hypothetical protein GCM10011512_05350 [Tersicoccus solisilvae]|uniref:Uncharacterized protein n=1 Tax=Tersicoccus solisilvae TaxID=1882339 RepID=A0ABQ1NNL7_9MICC|nr:hypothetical protein [Tersicoccus solisilvae]GGC81576.1 hypothetical protein GCM10011512_05350 [Tersicoccus solisilvae]
MDDDTYLDGTVVGATAIQCKAGSAEGRVAVTKDLKVIGILMVTPKHGRLPF